ncbi:MAG: MmcQ/YjbR family DNA-binding protein [Lachnospiraceae bacterium]|nr:MmcQ/YjbR family DNA-binding protein [Lachnospiraceae bacterium]
MVTRQDILDYAKDNYNTLPERLWAKYPEFEVLRHEKNNKWYAILMNVSRDKVGLKPRSDSVDEVDGSKTKSDSSDNMVDIINIKCDPDMIGFMTNQKGFAPAYHMNKKHWLSIILDGSVADEEIYNFIDLSYDLTE